MLDNVLIFDVWGKQAHFKKIYLTTSALSYGVPFKTSVYGLVGAILGLDNHNNEYLNSFNENTCKVAIEVRRPIKYQRINTNFSPNPGAIKNSRKPTMMEFVTNPYYRIYFWNKNPELMDKLSFALINKYSVYTPVLGLAHCLANFKYIDKAKIESKKGNALVHSVIPKSQLDSFDQDYWLDQEIHIQEQDMYPLEMNNQREVIKRDSILYDVNGKALKVITKSHFELLVDEQKKGIMLM